MRRQRHRAGARELVLCGPSPSGAAVTAASRTPPCMWLPQPAAAALAASPAPSRARTPGRPGPAPAVPPTGGGAGARSALCRRPALSPRRCRPRRKQRRPRRRKPRRPRPTQSGWRSTAGCTNVSASASASGQFSRAAHHAIAQGDIKVWNRKWRSDMLRSITILDLLKFRNGTMTASGENTVCLPVTIQWSMVQI